MRRREREKRPARPEQQKSSLPRILVVCEGLITDVVQSSWIVKQTLTPTRAEIQRQGFGDLRKVFARSKSPSRHRKSAINSAHTEIRRSQKMSETESKVFREAWIFLSKVDRLTVLESGLPSHQETPSCQS